MLAASGAFQSGGIGRLKSRAAPLPGTLVLLLNGEGADASTTFTDESSYARTFTPQGNAQIDTAQFRFGSSSMLFDGTGDVITSPHAAELNFATGDFTIGMWIRPNASSQTAVLLNKAVTTGTYPYQLFLSAGALVFRGFNAAATQVYNITLGSPPSGSWSYVELCRWGDILIGTLAGKMNNNGHVVLANGTTLINNASAPLSIGGNSNAANSFNGWIDNAFMLSGSALHRENFKPSAVAFA